MQFHAERENQNYTLKLNGYGILIVANEKSTEIDRISSEHLLKFQREAVEDRMNIHRTSNERLSSIQRTSEPH